MGIGTVREKTRVRQLERFGTNRRTAASWGQPGSAPSLGAASRVLVQRVMQGTHTMLPGTDPSVVAPNLGVRPHCATMPQLLGGTYAYTRVESAFQCS